MAEHEHLSPTEEIEHDTSVFMHVVVYVGIAFIVLSAVALLIVYGTNGRMIPRSSQAHPTSQIILIAPFPARAIASYVS